MTDKEQVRERSKDDEKFEIRRETKKGIPKVWVHGKKPGGCNEGEVSSRKEEDCRCASVGKILEGSGLRGLQEPVVTGEVILNSQPVSFFGDFDTETGDCINPDHDMVERSVKDKILVFPSGAGSTVGSYSLINLSLNDAAPKAILVNQSDPVILIGCCVADIPHVHRFTEDITKALKDGMKVKVDSERGVVEVVE